MYKKDRSVQRTAEGDIHSAPGGRVGTILGLANILWVIVFGWWLALASFAGGLCCYVFLWTDSGRAYGNVLLGLSWYLFYPFGQFVELKQEEAYMEEDEGEGRSISEYEQWQAGDLEVGRSFFGPHTPRSLIGRRRDSIDTAGESDSLLGTHDRTGYTGEDSPTRGATKRRLFGRGEWNIGRIIFFVWFYAIIGKAWFSLWPEFIANYAVAPLLLLVSGLCWWMVFTIPMAKVTSLLFSHLRRHPLALSFHSDYSYSRPSTGSILLCTYRAVGWKYYKYTIDGTNIFFINLMSVVFFVIADHYILAEGMGLKSWITAPGTIFTLALFSVIPLAYFIGQAVASISAQSSMGMGATINAFFSTVVEVFLYCVALGEGKARLVEGSIVGSILAGILFMPGLSMCSGAIKRKTQRFNANSAGVTSTMLLYAVIGAFAPTLFYQIYGTYELSCTSCTGKVDTEDCRRCIFSQTPTATDRFYHEAVLPFTYIASIFLFISYLIGLWFTLRTHAAIIWQVPPATTAAPTAVHPTIAAAPNRLPQREQDGVGQQGGYQSESARNTANMRDSVLYKRILGQSLSGVGYRSDGAVPTPVTAPSTHPGQSLHVVPPRSVGDDIMSGPLLRNPPVSIPGLSSEQNAKLVRGVAEVAAAAATAAVQDVQRQHETQYGTVRKIQPHTTVTTDVARVSQPTAVATPAFELDGFIGGAEAVHGGHDAPNWGKHKSAVILLGATVLYAIIAG